MSLASSTTADACLEWLDGLMSRHEMLGCARSRQNPAGLRRWPCESDIHIRDGQVSIYVRDSNGRVVAYAHAQSIRGAIAGAARALEEAEGRA